MKAFFYCAIETGGSSVSDGTMSNSSLTKYLFGIDCSLSISANRYITGCLLLIGNLIDSKIEGQLIEFIINFGNQSINWLITFESIKNQLRTLIITSGKAHFLEQFSNNGNVQNLYN